MTSTDVLIEKAELAATVLRAKATIAAARTAAPLSERLERPRRRRHRAVPIEYRLSQSELIITGTALALLVGTLTFPLAWILFRWVA